MQLIFCPDPEVDLKSRPRFPAFEVGLYGAQVELLLPAPNCLDLFDWGFFFVVFFCICSWWSQISAFLEYHDPLFQPTPTVLAKAALS